MHDELAELEEELELDFKDCDSDNSDILYIYINTTTPPLDTSSDTILYPLSNEENAAKKKCSDDLQEIYKCSKKLLGDAANKKATVVLLPLTKAEKKYVTETKSNLDQYI